MERWKLQGNQTPRPRLADRPDSALLTTLFTGLHQYTPTRYSSLRTCGPDGRVHAISEKECLAPCLLPQRNNCFSFFPRSRFRLCLKRRRKEQSSGQLHSRSEASTSESYRYEMLSSVLHECVNDRNTDYSYSLPYRDSNSNIRANCTFKQRTLNDKCKRSILFLLAARLVAFLCVVACTIITFRCAPVSLKTSYLHATWLVATRVHARFG